MPRATSQPTGPSSPAPAGSSPTGEPQVSRSRTSAAPAGRALEGGAQPVGVAQQLPRLLQRPHRVADLAQAERLGQGGGAGRAAPLEHLLQRRAEPGRVGAEHLAGDPDQAQGPRRAPDQAERPQPGDLLAGVGAPGAPDRGGGDRLREHGHRLDDLQGGRVEQVEGPLHAGAGGGADGERAQVGGDGDGQVAAGLQERDQLGVVPGPQVVGEAARGVATDPCARRCRARGHPLHGTPPRATSSAQRVPSRA